MIGQPLIVTERLELWRPERRDIDQMIAIVMNEETARYLGPTQTANDQYNRFLRNVGCWDLYGYGGMILRERGREPVIGNCGIFHSRRGLGEDFDDMPEAGWIIGSDHGGKGYAMEAMSAVFEWFARELGPMRVMCIISPENTPSLRVAEKLGFTMRDERPMPDGEPVLIFDRTA